MPGSQSKATHGSLGTADKYEHEPGNYPVINVSTLDNDCPSLKAYFIRLRVEASPPYAHNASQSIDIHRADMSIKRREFLKKAGAGAAGVAALSSCGGGGSGETQESGGAGISGPRVSWRLATSFPESLDILHGAGVRVARRVEELTGGNFTIRVYQAGEIVPALQVMDAVMQGTVQCGVSPGYYYIGKNPSFAFDTAIPFGLSTRQQYAWMMKGGGLELLNSLYADFGVISFPCNSTGGQMGGWFREPVNSLEDMAGLRFRMPGIGGEVMSRLGVTVQNLGARNLSA